MSERLLLQTAIEDAQASFRAAFRTVLESTRSALCDATQRDFVLHTLHSPAEPVSPASTPTGATGGAGEAQEARE